MEFKNLTKYQEKRIRPETDFSLKYRGMSNSFEFREKLYC